MKPSSLLLDSAVIRRQIRGDIGRVHAPTVPCSRRPRVPDAVDSIRAGRAVRLRSERAFRNVSVINTETNAVVATIPVGSYPEGVAVNPAGTRVYVTNVESGTVSVIDAATNMVVATVPVGMKPFGVATNPAGTRVYVGNFKSDTVSVIDGSTGYRHRDGAGGGDAVRCRRRPRGCARLRHQHLQPPSLGDRRFDRHGRRDGAGGIHSRRYRGEPGGHTRIHRKH